MADAKGITQGEAADRLGISTARVRELTRIGVLSRNEDGSYDEETIVGEYDAYKRTQSSNDGQKAELARLTRARAEAQEMENAKLRGRLIDVDDVEPLLRTSLERVNAVMKNVPSRYGARLARKGKIKLPDAKALLAEIVEAVREELRHAVPEGDDAAA